MPQNKKSCFTAVLFFQSMYNSHRNDSLTCLSSVQFSCSVVSDSLWFHGLQHSRLPCPSPALGACSNSSPLSQWCHPTISSSVNPLLLPPSVFLSNRVFSSELALCIKYPKYWHLDFSNNPSSEYSGFVSFTITWFDLLAVHRTLKGLLQHHS